LEVEVQSNRSVSVAVGVFVLIALVGIVFLALQASNARGFRLHHPYELEAQFGDISGLSKNAKITMAGVQIGKVKSISYDQDSYKAKVILQISGEYDSLPLDSRADILTAGLLGEKYIPNDIFLDRDTQQIMMVTGPNMSGKSAVLRQTAIICLLAQIGSFVPAKHAEIGVLDRIFTRVGASDNISAGESTFMVEMNESANILNNITERSLILLDEIGRGTSTYDGISIAWAIAEYLHQHPTQPKTLFATHYHELNEMQNSFSRIKNYHIAIQENKNNVIFLRKLVAGGSEHSFGIYVAKLAGMPTKVVNRAKEILKTLENSRSQDQNMENIKRVTEENLQLSFFQLDDPALESIREELTQIDINTLTPIEALMKLNKIKNMIGK